jgi:hypothetical protein
MFCPAPVIAEPALASARRALTMLCPALAMFCRTLASARPAMTMQSADFFENLCVAEIFHMKNAASCKKVPVSLCDCAECDIVSQVFAKSFVQPVKLPLFLVICVSSRCGIEIA